MADQSLPFLSIAELARAYRSGSLSPLEVTENLLARIEALEGSLNAFRLVCRERALAAAKAAETALAAGQDLSPLQGIPFAVKDLFDVRGMPTSAGSRLRESGRADRDATAVNKLLRAGMVLLGKTNTVQFAYGGVGINHDHGTPHNPWSRTHHAPGGSSSGSAVAVAAGLAPLALGTDTGGSVRIPSSFCGLTGLKTTVGRVSRAGVYPLSWTLDSVGPLVRTAEDAALVLEALQGQDLADETTLGVIPQDPLSGLDQGVKGLKLAFAESVFWEGVDPEVAGAVREAGRVLRDLGAGLESIGFPVAQKVMESKVQALVLSAEAYKVNRVLVEESYDRLDPVIAPRLLLGKEVTVSQYLEAKEEMMRLREEAGRLMTGVDALLVPTTIRPAPEVAQADRDRETYTAANLASLQNTSVGNSLGLCGLSLPCGFTSQGLPVGLMIYGRPFQEGMILRIGRAFQEATGWHQRRPDLSWAGSEAE